MTGADSHGEERRLLSRNVCRCGGQRELAQIFKRPVVNRILVALLRDRLSLTRAFTDYSHAEPASLHFFTKSFLAQNSTALEARPIVSLLRHHRLFRRRRGVVGFLSHQKSKPKPSTKPWEERIIIILGKCPNRPQKMYLAQ